MVNEIEYVDIIDLLKVCNDYLGDPTEENTKKFNDMQAKIIIKPYLTLDQKENIIKRIFVDVQTSNTDGLSFVNEIELSMVLYGVLGYTNINPETVQYVRTEEVYDTLIFSGIVDYILEFCEKDYKRLESMVEKVSAWDNILNLINAVNQLEVGNIEELTEEFKQFRLNTDKQYINDLADIMRTNDKLFNNIKNTMIDNAASALSK